MHACMHISTSANGSPHPLGKKARPVAAPSPDHDQTEIWDSIMASHSPHKQQLASSIPLAPNQVNMHVHGMGPSYSNPTKG